MKKFYEKVTAKPKLVIAVFVILAVVCALCKPFISVNYDMNDYLPDNSKSTVSLDVMNEEFDGGIPNVRVMVKDVTVPEAMEYKEKIQAVEGVSDVMWLDDSLNIDTPLEFQDKDAVESYYKDGNALFSITLDEEHILDGVDAIRDIIGDDNAMEGSAVSTAVATESTVTEIAQIASIAVAFVLLVLVFTTTSWAEPVVILLGLGVAIIINMGSNIIFGEISFVSNAAGAILQLAVSLDYSVFLLHRFEESRKDFSDPKEAMVDALCKSTSSILSSGVTTVIGFLALCLMRFRIGPDLGLVLAKGVAISLISVFIFMPNFILTVCKIIDKTHHRKLVPGFEKFGKTVRKVMIPFACIFAVIIVPAYLASNSNDYYYGSSHIFNEETQLGSDTALIEETFGKSDTYVLLVPKGDQKTQLELSDEIKKLPQVKDIISYVDTVGNEIPQEYLDEETLSMLESENYSRMVLSLDTDYEGEETFDLVEEIRTIAEDFYNDKYYLAGNGVSTYDLMNTVTSDMMKVNLIAIGAVFVVLLLTMKSISLPVILVLSIETAIWLNLSFPYFTDNTIFYIAYLIISSIQLGATVDYAILMTDRYMEYRKEMPKKQAVVETISSCTVSILTSGSVLTVVGFLLGYISTHGLLAQLGIFLGRGTLCSLAIVMFVLPGLLCIFDKLIEKTTKGAEFYKGV
ncbi:efflux RND transporter permease subunit [Porcipelethomonas sp.]|uniref:efflux RND transporter permease subunit n=1 Tax=Porcipelethomonas sp. TaxID=2981675 RepID=UPI003EFA9EB5